MIQHHVQRHRVLKHLEAGLIFCRKYHQYTLKWHCFSQSRGFKNPALIFKGKDSYDISQYGWGGSDGNYTHRVQRNGVDVLEFIETTPPSEIFEQYDLAWSAYAIVPQGNNPDDFNLTLHYNYQPWHGENYKDDADVAVLVEHVSTFRFTQIGDTIRLKLCISDAKPQWHF